MVSERQRFQINWTNSVGAALAAVSSALVLSTFGVAGTLIGAAVGSLCISVGGAFYAHSMQVAKERMESARVAAARQRVRRNPAAVPNAVRQLEPGADPGVSTEEPRVWALEELPWKRIVAATLALFLITMALIVAFELTVGRPVSSITGNNDPDRRTSIPGLGNRDNSPDKQAPDKQPESPDSPQQSEQPTPTPEPELPPVETPTPATPTETTPPAPLPTDPPVEAPVETPVAPAP